MRGRTKSITRAVVPAILLLMLLARVAPAQSICDDAFAGSSAASNAGVVSSVLATTLLIMLTMLMVLGIVYALGYALQIGKFVRFAKSEFGEIAITMLLVFIFLGSFKFLYSGAVPQTFAAVAGSGFGKPLFEWDCNALTGISTSELLSVAQLDIYQLLFNALSGLVLTLKPNGAGVNLVPLMGLSPIGALITPMMSIGFLLSVIPLASSALMIMSYFLFPIFLYAGIILRSIPWTRAAGGAFIGAFVAFYLVFPLLVYGMLSTYMPNVGVSTSVAGTAANIGIGAASGAISFLTNIIFVLTGFDGLIPWYMSYVVEPVAYTFLSLVVAFIISFDFMEAVGDLLGAQSLSSSHTLKKLL